MKIDIDMFCEEVRAFIEDDMGFSKDWSQGGCYLHLEVSEFIEALRGKGDPVEELTDVFNTLFSLAGHYGIKPSDAIKNYYIKKEKMLMECNRI